MAVAIRLTRVGATKRPSYRVIAIDKRRSRDGRALEILGFYDPLTDPATVRLETDKIKAWIGKGAQPSDAVVRLMRQAENAATARTDAPAPKRATRKPGGKPSKKALAKAQAAAEAPAAEEAPAAKAAPEAAPAADEAVTADAPAEEAATAEAPSGDAGAEAAPQADEAVADEAPADEAATAEAAAEEAPAEAEAEAAADDALTAEEAAADEPAAAEADEETKA